MACLAILAFVSGCETALTAIRRIQSRRSLSTSGETTRELDTTISGYHASLVVTRLLGIIGTVSMATLLAMAFIGLRWWAIAAAGLSSAMLVLLVEASIRPAVAKKPESFLERVAILLALLSSLTSPITRLLPVSSESPFIHETSEEEEETGPLADAQEFKQLITDLDETPDLLEDETEMIDAILSLKETAVKEIMVPRPDITAISADAKFDDLVELISKSGRSRIPLYEGSIDNIIGVIHAQDVLRYLRPSSERADLRTLARKPFFIPENKNVYELLDEFRDTGVHFALVVDEYGGVEGLVTLNDVLEEIVGGLVSEFEPNVPAVRPVDESEALVEGNASLEDVNEALGTELKDEQVETIGGYVLHHLGHIPKVGETLVSGNIEAQIVSTAGRRIKRLRIKKLATEQHEPAKS